MKPSLASARGPAWLVGLVVSGVACGVLSPGEPPVPVEVRFRGYTTSLASTRAVLTTSAGRTEEWLGDPAVPNGGETLLGTVAVRPGDSLVATAQVRDQAGELLAEARLVRAVQSGYAYVVRFQVGGRNPDFGGFCHQRPARAPLAGLQGDTLFLWWYGLPRDAVC